MAKFNKLVRDKIPAIIQANGETPKYHVIRDDKEFLKTLFHKYIEEGEELANELNLEELADVLEVVYAIAAALGYTPEQIEQARVDKAEKRGGFKNRIFLENTD